MRVESAVSGCGCRSRNECCAPGIPGCRQAELPRSIERDLQLVRRDCRHLPRYSADDPDTLRCAYCGLVLGRYE